MMNLEAMEYDFRFTNQTCEEIGKKHGITRKKVAHIAKSNGWNRAYNDKVWLAEQYESGLLIKDIADKIGCHHNALAIKFRKFEIVTDSRRRYHKKNNYNHDYFEFIDTEDKAYWLGFIVADGNISEDGKSKRLTIRLSVKDIEHLKKFSLVLSGKDIVKIKQTTHRDNRKQILELASLRVYSTPLCNHLANLGVFPAKSGNELLPEIPRELYRHFIRGFVDGDGSVGMYSYEKTPMRYPAFSLSSMSEDIMKSIQSILNEEIQLNLTVEKSRANLYRLQCSRLNAKKLINWLYEGSTVALERKKAVYLEIISTEDIVRSSGEIPESQAEMT